MHESDLKSYESQTQPAGVKVFRIQMAVLIAVYTALVYGGIYLLTRSLLLDSVHNQASSYASLVLDIRTWNASHGGVWILKSDGVQSNPFLTELGVPADIKTEAGATLTLRDHSTMTREISEITRPNRGVWFHLTSLDYVNPANAPDAWERAALERVNADLPAVGAISPDGDRRAYRVVERLVVDRTCLECHRTQGYKLGDTIGGVSITVPMERTDAQLRTAAGVLAALGLLTFGLSLLAVNYLTGRMQKRIEEANERLQQAAITDALTGVLNHGAALARLAEEFERSRREDQPLSVVMLDLDHFKGVNDSFGHAAGDCVLREFVNRAGSSVRAYDVIGRLGGEEFLIVAPGTDAETAYNLAARVLEHVRSSPIDCGTGVIMLTTSAGVATIEPSDDDFEKLLGRADAALYRAKDLGRDRTEVAET